MITIPKFKIRMIRDGRGIKISTPTAVAEVIRQVCCENPVVETICVVFLDGRTNLQGVSVIAMGGTNSASVKPSEILQLAIVAGAQGIILGHNHPSGSRFPSKEDHIITDAIAKSCEIVGIPLLDHIIVTEERDSSYYSFHECGHL